MDRVRALRLGGRHRPRAASLVAHSPLRSADPRVKIALSLCASLAVMLPLARLGVFLLLYGGLLLWARLGPAALRQAWRLRWVLLVLFAADWVLVDLPHAVTVAARVALLAGVLVLLFATTTPREFGLALERLGLPYRLAFSLGLAFQSVELLEGEWQSIWEAQVARGALPASAGRWDVLRRVRDLVALTVPAVVLTTRRAWAITEAAYARGFDSPERRPYHQLHLSARDAALLAGAVLATLLLLLLWR